MPGIFALRSSAVSTAKEIVEGNILGIPARISVFSRDVVDENYERLSLLDVRDCEASVQSDKDMIISKIADIDVFNLRHGPVCW